MIRLTDGKKIAEITMNVWNSNGYTPDFSLDFFEVGALPYDEEKEAYVVDDVDYCIEQANDWKDSNGDFVNDEPNPDNNVDVHVEEIKKYVILDWVDNDAFEEEVEADNDQDAIADAYAKWESLADSDKTHRLNFTLYYGYVTEDGAIDTDRSDVVAEFAYGAPGSLNGDYSEDIGFALLVAEDNANKFLVLYDSVLNRHINVDWDLSDEDIVRIGSIFYAHGLTNADVEGWQWTAGTVHDDSNFNTVTECRDYIKELGEEE